MGGGLPNPSLQRKSLEGARTLQGRLTAPVCAGAGLAVVRGMEGREEGCEAGKRAGPEEGAILCSRIDQILLPWLGNLLQSTDALPQGKKDHESKSWLLTSAFKYTTACVHLQKSKLYVTAKKKEKKRGINIVSLVMLP